MLVTHTGKFTSVGYSELSICTTHDSRKVDMPISFMCIHVCFKFVIPSGVMGGGGGRGAQRLLTRKFLLTYQEKGGKEKKLKRGEKWRRKRWKIEEGKVENFKWNKMEGGKGKNEERTFFFFFFLLFTFQNL